MSGGLHSKPNRQMRTAVLAAPRRFILQNISIPEPGPDEVLVRLEGSGICASNFPVWEGQPWFDYPRPPGALGHEGWGVVEAVGPRVSRVRPGQRVALLSEHAYAEYDKAREDQVIPLPPSLEGRPFPGEAFGCALNIFHRSDVKPGMTVAVVGTGFLGLLLVRLCRDAGARVIALSRRESALESARQFGAATTIQMQDHATILSQLSRETDGRLCERVMEVTGKQWPLDLAGEACAEGGKLIIAGYHQDGPRQVNLQMWNWKGLDVINAHERRDQVRADGVRAAADAICSGAMDLEALLTHRVPLERLNEAFELMERRPEGFLKAIVTM